MSTFNLRKYYEISPTTNHVSVAILIAVATELAVRSFGAVLVPPVLRIVVVAGVAA